MRKINIDEVQQSFADQNPSWLPNKKYYEYAYHKFFNPEISYIDWTPWDEWTYPDRDLLRFDHIIGKQIAHIQNKRVLDVACHLGYLSLFCLHNRAAYVTGTNIRDRELSIATEVAQLAGYNNYEFVNSNIYNLDEFYKLCNTHDTVLLSGILYHINNHYQLLKTIADSSAQTLILESSIENAIDIAEYPIVNWKLENTDISTSGFEDNQSTTFVGIPNHKWIEQTLKQLAFKITYNEIIEYSNPMGRRVKRCILIGQKI
jgi:2-polyprenyl-3-methyl-5-hydroxy-6-metoxy-1,4-benzoquinol methylase